MAGVGSPLYRPVAVGHRQDLDRNRLPGDDGDESARGADVLVEVRGHDE
jgi:hypothetical protein